MSFKSATNETGPNAHSNTCAESYKYNAEEQICEQCEAHERYYFRKQYMENMIEYMESQLKDKDNIIADMNEEIAAKNKSLADKDVEIVLLREELAKKSHV